MTRKLTITRERLSGIARGENCYTHDDVIELALAQLAAMDSEPRTDDELSNLLWFSQEATCHSDPNYFCEFQRLAAPGLIAGIIRELQERRKAAMDNEPVSWTSSDALADVYCGITSMMGPEDTVGDIPLYRHAQPAPVSTFYRDGIEAAAKWIDQQREAYDSEHGWSDPDTGSFEFGSEIKREYSSTLEDLAEGIRALHPNAGNSPVIPDRWIPVSERMPEGSGTYQVWNGKHVGAVPFLFGSFQCLNPEQVTHWMPTAKPPLEMKP